MSTLYDQFADVVRSAGLIQRQCKSDHWQIIGGAKPVNVYPFGKRGFTFYVSGAVRGTRGRAATLENAIKAASHGECTPQAKVKRFGCRQKQREKKRLMASDPQCRWCRQELHKETARLDHIAPIDQGGSNRRDNLCLACMDCDLNKRGNKAIKPKLEVNAAAADVVFAAAALEVA